MTIESNFLAALIGGAERRLAFQAFLVGELPDGSASKQAISACELLQLFSLKVIALHRERERQSGLSEPGKQANKR